MPCREFSVDKEIIFSIPPKPLKLTQDSKMLFLVALPDLCKKSKAHHELP